MIQSESGSKIVMCCAQGEVRGPGTSVMVPGSEFVREGYVGLWEWLRAKKLEEQVSDIQLFYSGSVILLIADRIDREHPYFSRGLAFVSSLLECAQILHMQYEHEKLVSMITCRNIYPIP